MRRPGDWPASQIELLMSLDQYGRQIVDASGVTPERGRVAHLHLTTDPAHSGEPSRMVIPLDAVAPAGEQMTIHDARAAITTRIRRDLQSLTGQSERPRDHVRVVRLFVVGTIGEMGGADLLPAVLLVGQQLKTEQAGYGVVIVRYVLLVLRPPEQGGPGLVHPRAEGLLNALASNRLPGGGQLHPPIAEHIVVVGHPQFVRPSLRRQVHDGAEILRVLAEAGPTGQAVRSALPAASGSRVFQLVGVAPIELRRTLMAAWLAVHLLGMDARERANRVEIEGAG